MELDALDLKSVGEAIADTVEGDLYEHPDNMSAYVPYARAMGEQLQHELELRGFQITRLPR